MRLLGMGLGLELGPMLMLGLRGLNAGGAERSEFVAALAPRQMSEHLVSLRASKLF